MIVPSFFYNFKFVLMILPLTFSFIPKLSRRCSLNTCIKSIYVRCLTTSIQSQSVDELVHSHPTEHKNSILALDFDGVICASSLESSYAAVVSASKCWPTVFKKLTSYTSTESINIQKSIQTLRPVIETGYENMLLARYLYENEYVSLDYIAREWVPMLKDKLLHFYQVDKDDLIKAFGATRDDLIKTNLPQWLKMNTVYPQVQSVLSTARLDRNPNCYIITTKQMRFVEAILNNNAITSLPSKRIFDLDNPYGSKVKVLAALTDQYNAAASIAANIAATTAPVSLNQQSPPTTATASAPLPPQPLEIHFLEDRLETLLKVDKDPKLNHVHLYLVDWGYNTAADREAAKNHSRIQLIGYKEFEELISRFKVKRKHYDIDNSSAE